jgi:putative transcriptional regulator
MISNTVEEKRKAKGMTQADLGEAVGVSRQTIIAIEKGNYSPSLELAFKMSRILQAPIEKIFNYVNTKK